MEESAIRIYVKFIEKFPNDPRVSQIPQKAVIRATKQQPVKAPTPPKEMLQSIDKAEASELFQRALEHYERKEWNKAIDLYDEVLRLNPKNSNAAYNKGLIYKTMNDNQKAKEAFSQSLSINPDTYKARYMLALIYREENTPEKAVEELNSALRTKPDYSDAHYVLGITYWKLMKYDTAMTHFKRYLQIDPKGKYAKTVQDYIDKRQQR